MKDKINWGQTLWITFISMAIIAAGYLAWNGFKNLTKNSESSILNRRVTTEFYKSGMRYMVIETDNGIVIRNVSLDSAQFYRRQK